MNTGLGQGPIPSSSVWMASTFLLKGSQHGSARAPRAHPSQAARTLLPHAGATPLGLQNSRASWTWTTGSVNTKHVVRGTTSLPCLRPSPAYNVFLPAHPVKFCKSFRTTLKCYIFSVAFSGTLPNQSEQTTSSFLFLAGFCWCPYQLILDLFVSVHQPESVHSPWVASLFHLPSMPAP